MELGLERIRGVMEALGRPDAAYDIIHVAGTNGKGSTAAMIEAGLMATGLRVGKFVSPYLRVPRDAVTVNNVAVTGAEWSDALAAVHAAEARVVGEGRAELIGNAAASRHHAEVTAAAAAVADAAPGAAAPMSSGAAQQPDSVTAKTQAPAVTQAETACSRAPSTKLTTFETWTAAAYLLFQRHGVDTAVIEVGVGGALDATNVCGPPAVAVVTSISYDHMELLGPTLRHIATHKAGIIKPGCIAVLAPHQAPETVAVIQARAAETGARLIQPEPLTWEAGESVDASSGAAPRFAIQPRTGARIPVPFLGDFQLDNAAAAAAALTAYLETARGTQAHRRDAAVAIDGMGKAMWHGRLEWVSLPPAGTFLVDGGHNEDALAKVRAAIDGVAAVRGCSKAVFVYAGTASRDLATCLRLLLRPGDSLLAVPFSTPEGMPWIRHHPTEAVAAAARSTARGVTARVCSSLQEAIELCACDPDLAHPATLRVCCGSLYLMSDLYRMLGDSEVADKPGDAVE